MRKTLKEVMGIEDPRVAEQEGQRAIDLANELSMLLYDIGDYQNAELASKLVQALKQEYGS